MRTIQVKVAGVGGVCPNGHCTGQKYLILGDLVSQGLCPKLDTTWDYLTEGDFTSGRRQCGLKLICPDAQGRVIFYLDQVGD